MNMTGEIVITSTESPIRHSRAESDSSFPRRRESSDGAGIRSAKLDSRLRGNDERQRPHLK